MADVFNKRKRSEVMSKIGSKNTKPEMIVRQFLHANGYRFRLHDKGLPGRPDLKLSRYNTLILINGCYWHGHVGCKYHVLPASNREFWINKIENNRLKDTRNLRALKELGWKVITIWECDLKPSKRDKTLTLLIKALGKV